jgi:hypothetical protein
MAGSVSAEAVSVGADVCADAACCNAGASTIITASLRRPLDTP